MTHKKGSTLGAILLIGASCIGAGMLGLPLQTGIAGFFPSLLMFICIWAFMMLTGLLIAEVGSRYQVGANFLTLVQHTLGKPGKVVCWIFYLFLFYALLVAFISVSGHLLSSILQQHLSFTLPPDVGSIFFVILFGILVYCGTRTVDLCNRGLMIAKITAFLGLLILGVRFVQGHNLLFSNPSKIPAALPILVTAFGYQNLVPILNNYMQGDLKRLKRAIIGGSLFSLVIYAFWQTVVMGIIPLSGPNSIEEGLRLGKEATEIMSAIMQSSWLSPLAQLFGFFAVLTSFLAQSLALSHFLSEGLSISYKKHENIGVCALTLLPPLLLAVLFPDIFFKALNFAGGFCTVVLFGILPVLMAWKGRYLQKHPTGYAVLGGKGLLIAVFALSLYIFLFEINSMFSFF